MIILAKFDKTKTYIFPNNKIATPDLIAQEYPATQSFTYFIQTDKSGQMLYSLENLAAARGELDIDDSLDDDEAIAAIENLRNNPPEPRSTEPTLEERSAAALEAIADGQTTENKNALDILLGEE